MPANIATLKNIVIEQPQFSLRNFCGKYKALPDNNSILASGGLRTKGMYKKTTKDKPLVTFITSVRNNKDGIEKCMESIWNQTYDNIEYIVVDGASTDGTVELLFKNEDKIDYFVSEPDEGIYYAYNKALSLATGDVIAIINSDDWAFPNAAMIAATNFQSEKFDMLFGVAMYHDVDGHELYRYPPFIMNEGSILLGTPVCHNATYFSRSAYEKVGYYSKSLPIAADFNWMIDAWLIGAKISYSQDMFVHYSLGGTSDNLEKYTKDAVEIIIDKVSDLSTEEATVLVKHFCMFYPTRYFSQEDKLKIGEIVDKHKNNSLLLMMILKCLLFSKTAQYEDLASTKLELISGSRLIEVFLKNKIADLLRNTFLFRPAQRLYQLFKKN
ncbi:glycosyltransferase [Sporomusa sphaeroides DSM 2875]|uniref:glycosyltransferase family 2 protein n=1 Tax=Sporomusa sphaeroides TaxID=47679 RepID=UPI00203091B3|nr:glycosyltransferase family 2 protein [Sporomusa sphaeroides]MCM0758034.1 glycosyltransferase [Sporomusa sphaeroides DSM 2875]